MMDKVRVLKDVSKDWRILTTVGNAWPNFKAYLFRLHQDWKQELKTSTSNFAGKSNFSNYAREIEALFQSVLYANDTAVEEYTQNLPNLTNKNQRMTS